MSAVIIKISPEKICEILQGTDWAECLDDDELESVSREATLKAIFANQRAVISGESADWWVGVVSGLFMQAITEKDGRQTVISISGQGAWFGEGTLLKHETWKYDVIAVKDSQILLIPKSVFFRLRQTNIAFNHYLTDQLNQRLGLFVGMLVNDRLLSPDIRLARNLAAMHAAKVYGIDEDGFLPVNQGALALLSGISRQRANMGLQKLQGLGLIKVRNNGTEILNAAGLLKFSE